MFEEERPSLIGYRGPFDAFHAVPASVSKTCLVRFDSNKYSVAARAVGRPVEVYAYAERIVIRQDGKIVAEHARRFGRDQTFYDPWHYVPVLARKPGALRNGAPFKDWALPDALGRVRVRLASHDDGDRQMVEILTAVLEDGRRRSRQPVPRRSWAARAAPTSCSTSSIVGASPPRRHRSRHRRACVFALSRWPTAPATTA